MVTSVITQQTSLLVGYTRPQPVEASPTVVAPAQAVAPPPAIDNTSADANPQPGQQRTATGFTLDPSSHELIYQVKDEGSGSVVFQLPTDETLKARAYQQQIDRSRQSQQVEPGETADLKA